VRVRHLVDVAALAGVAGSLASFLGPFDERFDLLTHFRLLAAGLSVGLLVLAIVCRRRAAIVLATACVVLHAGPALARYLPSPLEPEAPCAARLRIVLFNVRVDNELPLVVARFLAARAPDLVIFQEATREFAAIVERYGELEPVVADYRSGEDRKRAVSVHRPLASRMTVLESAILRADPTFIGMGFAVVRGEVQGRTFTLIAPRLPPPVVTSRRAVRHRHLSLLRSLTAAANEPVILAGDLNTTPFATDFKALLRDAGLLDASAGDGPLGTFPAAGVLSLAALPIDHLLHSPDWRTHAYEVVRDELGSDHHPVIVDLALR
jgi:endonuclease/exonuclease/phosphatase (EEP) superfamily protein YafD